MPAWVLIGRRTGKKWGYILAIVLYALPVLSWLFAKPGISHWGLDIRSALTGFGVGGILLMSISMLPDIMEHDFNLTGLRREGVFSSFYAIVEKVGFAIGPGIGGVYLAQAGYLATMKGHLVQQPPDAIRALYWSNSVIPAALMLISITLISGYNIDERTEGAGMTRSWTALAAFAAAALVTQAGAALAGRAGDRAAALRPRCALASSPDYSLPSSWAALPQKADAADEQSPSDPLKEAQATAPADVFYIHPTTLRSKAHWNQRTDDAATDAWTDASVIARQASAWNACCKVYAPRYRQAGPVAYYASKSDGPKAYELGYQDVKRAFEYYLAHYNHGRPFIIAGHSQGALDTYHLIVDLIDGKPLQRQLVAAYAVGVGASLGDFGRTYKSVQPCRKPADLHCIASWNTFTRSGDTAAYIVSSEARYTAKYGDEGKALLCTNPLTFDLDRPDAPASANLGSLPGKPGEPLPPLILGVVGGTCVDGVLRGRSAGRALHADRPAQGRPALPRHRPLL